MNDREENGAGRKSEEPVEKPQDAPPPQDHDETHEADPEELMSYIDSFEDGDFSEENPKSEIEEEYGYLIGEDEGSWIEDESEKPSLEVDLDSDVAGESWVEDEKDRGGLFEEDWFIEDDTDTANADDDDSEGPVSKEAYHISEETWDDLDARADEEEEEEIWDAMKRLGITLTDSPDEEAKIAEQEDLPEAVFLGPSGGGIVAATFTGGSPMAVGEGMFVLGADGMLHETESSVRIAEMQATSICGDGEIVFIGTRHGGAFATKDRGATLVSLNSWYTQGLNGGGEMPVEELSTSFAVLGQEFLGGYRLLGCTGEGQIFRSLDWGLSWFGPLLKGRCSSMIPVGGTGELLVLVESPGKRTSLMRSSDLVSWQELSLPTRLADSLTRHPVCMAACRDTIVMGSADPEIPLYRSVDKGAHWAAVPELRSVSAVLIDPEEPSWMAVASYNEKRGFGSVRVSDNNGDDWKRVLVTKPPSDTGDHRAEQETGASERIVGLIINPARARELLAVTPRGAYLVNLTRRGLAH